MAAAASAGSTCAGSGSHWFSGRATNWALPPNVWWARVAVTGGYGYLLADNADLARWHSWLISVAGSDLAEYKDFGGGIKRPATLETDSPLYKGYKSVMQWSGLKKRDFPDEIFTLNYLPRVQELRK